MGRALGLCIGFVVKAFAEIPEAPLDKPLLDAAQLAYDQLPKGVLEAAGFPKPHDLVCKALNSSALQAKSEKVICSKIAAIANNSDSLEACNSAIQFAWRQEAAEEKCPGAPKPWWPFHLLHEMANKLICFELKQGSF